MRTLSALLVVTLCAPASAESAPNHLERGQRLYGEGRYREALDELSLVDQAELPPEVLFELGDCHRRLHHSEEAIFFLKGYLERAQPAERDRAEALIREEEAALRTRGERRPAYRTWWLWSAVGLVVAAGVTAIALTVPAQTRLPSGPLGTIDARH